MTTEFGKELKKLRIDHEERLYDMAQKLKKSSAFLSSVELGKKSPPVGFENSIAEIYKLSREATDALFKAADRAREAFTLKPTSKTSRDTVGLFARKLGELSEEQMKAIQSLLRGDSQ
ncbi:helix-turn-helix domain-containing protein [Aristophania vespae]|uniref:hypothetical protein n=1 Tax=Aristophania vespae TaxID=2697033 RepID=UPI002351922D|nr:hypothetical protein [Aristophania vespae]UMM63077.1 hypothetical protein DM15PD_00310 [Aristophania vespae]